MKKTYLALALALLTSQATAEAPKKWTVHTISTHIGQSGLNNINPGIAYNTTDNTRIGVYLNSYSNTAFYAGYFRQVFHPRLTLGVGAVSGYSLCDGIDICDGDDTDVVPFVAAEIRITDMFSLAILGNAINLEVKF